jgi:EmrB/QacA subfamily drug resistance transporter
MDKKNSKTTPAVIGLLLGLFVAALDQTIVATAMPTVVKELGGFEQFVWVFSAYMIASVVATPIFGKLSDIYGRKRFFLMGIIVFLIGSVLCGLSSTMLELIIFRVIQGIGAGALMPITFAIIFDIFPPEKRGKMNGLFGAVFGLSSVFGPALGAFFTDYIDWRWVFYINLPIGIVSFFLIYSAYHESVQTRKQQIDWAGISFFIIAILGLMFAIEFGGSGTYPWVSPEIIGLFAIFVIFLFVFLWVEIKAADPMVELGLFKNRVFSASQAISFFYGAIMVTGATFIPLFVQGVYGESASAAGQTLTPMMLGVVASSIVGGMFINKTSYRNIMMVSTLILIGALFLLSTMTVDTPRWTVTVYMIFVGCGIGMNFSVLNVSTLHGIGNEHKGAAVSLIAFSRTIGSALGVTVLGAFQKLSFKEHINESFTDPAVIQQFPNPRDLLDPQIRAGLSSDVLLKATSALADSIAYLFIVGLVITVCALIGVFFLGKARIKIPAKRQDESDNDNENTVMASSH